MTRLRIGMIGAGMVAAHHKIAWERCADTDLVAIADPDKARAVQRADEYMKVFANLTDLLENTSVDAIDIATPVETHAALVIQAAAAGKAVLCQKPLAPTAQDARDLLHALPSTARVMLHENWRWRPGYRALQARLAEASPPTTFDFQCSSAGLLPAPDGTYPALQRQPFLAKLDRLIVFELLGHHLDVLHCMFGDVQILAARTERRCQAVIGEDFATVEVRAGATRGRLTGSFTKRGALTRPMDRLSLDGEVVISDMVLDWRGHRQEWTFDAAYQQSYDACIAHFVNCLQNDAPFATPAAHGIQLLDWIAEIYQLAQENR